MSQFSIKHVIEERNKRLMSWVADNLGLEGKKRTQLYTEMTLLFKYATDNEVAEYLLEKLASRKVIENAVEAKKTINHFHDIADGWLTNTADDLRN